MQSSPDPGIGFGKTVEHNLGLIKNLEYFKKFNCPLVVGVSEPVEDATELTVASEEPLPAAEAVAVPLAEGLSVVLEVAAVGVPDDKSGEAVKVVIVRKDPALTAEQVKDFCRENLTGYKHPRYVEFRDELPKSNVGKILRRELRDSPKTAA